MRRGIDVITIEILHMRQQRVGEPAPLHLVIGEGPGQIIVHREVGDRQSVYDTSEVMVVKRRNDFIRHRLLGFGAGDLLVSTADGRHEFELPNVLFADAKIREVAETMKTRPILAN